MSTEHPEGSGYHRFKELQTLEEILATATEFEATARDFYQALQTRVGNNLRPLIQELVEEEQRHYDLFTNLAARSDVQAHIADQIKTPASDHRFSDYIQIPKLEEFPDDQSILQYAIGREQAAMEQYDTLAKEAPAGPIQELFQYLAQEELEHKKELEKKYYELVHSGGV
jgi:rubrerythrin